jgi:phage shock protein PspC (stress-responsive transcriptional regulator)
MKNGKYNKAIVAVVTGVLNGLSVYYGAPEWLTAAISIAGVFGVYQVPNKQEYQR